MELAEALEHARRRTYATGSARVEVIHEFDWKLPPMPQRRHGGLLRPVMTLGTAVGKRLLRSATRKRRMTAVGVLDLAHRRCMVDYGSYAELYAGEGQWSGLSGRPLPTLPAFGLPGRRHPIWLLDLLSGVVSVEDHGNEDVRGVTCRSVTAYTDLSRASAQTPGGVAAPSRERFEEFLALPVDVWFDEAQIRRVRFVEDAIRTETIELFDFGVAIDDLDWTRLPSFRS